MSHCVVGMSLQREIKIPLEFHCVTFSEEHSSFIDFSYDAVTQEVTLAPALKVASK